MIQYFATTFLVSAGNRLVKSSNVSKFGAPNIIGVVTLAAFKLNVSMPILIWISDVIGDVAVIGVELEGVAGGVPGGVAGGVTGGAPGGVAGKISPGDTGLTEIAGGAGPNGLTLISPFKYFAASGCPCFCACSK